MMTKFKKSGQVYLGHRFVRLCMDLIAAPIKNNNFTNSQSVTKKRTNFLGWKQAKFQKNQPKRLVFFVSILAAPTGSGLAERKKLGAFGDLDSITNFTGEAFQKSLTWWQNRRPGFVGWSDFYIIFTPTIQWWLILWLTEIPGHW